MTNAAIIVAAGRGIRFGSEVPKQFQLLAGLPILHHSILLFERLSEFDQIRVVVARSDVEKVAAQLRLYPKLTGLAVGGERRQDSVWSGLLSLSEDTEIVAVHDAARPLAEPEAISIAVARARKMGAAILASPAVDTPKICEADGGIVQTLDRKSLWLAQTPQVFRYDLIRRAYRGVFQDGVEVTDDAAAVERLGERVEVVQPFRPNPKITTPDDLRYAEWLLSRRGDLTA